MRVYRATILICLALAGCASADKPQIVKVPVYHKAVPPADLASCPALGPAPVFLPVDGKPSWAALDETGQHRLTDILLAQKGCIDAWKAWISPN